MRLTNLFRIIIILFAINFSKAQLFTVTDEVSFPSKSYSAENLTKANLEVVYKLSYVHDVKKPESKRVEFLRLIVGDGYSKFGEYKREIRDSLEEVFSHKKTINSKDFNLYSIHSGQWKKDILKDYVSRKFRLQQFLVSYYETEDTLPKFEWKLLEETKEISGHLCYKATTNYKGRIYSAWFTKEIPISDGPYLFHGLPGLIIELEDSEKHYVFRLEGLKKVEKSVYWRNENRWTKISLKDFYKLEKSTFDNPGFYIKSKAIDENGNAIVPKFPPTPYNPIERN